MLARVWALLCESLFVLFVTSFVSTASACTAGTVQPSHVLEALYGKDSSRLKESLRISFSELNTVEEVQDFLAKLKEILS